MHAGSKPWQSIIKCQQEPHLDLYVPFLLWLQSLALDAVNTVAQDVGDGQREIDIKKYAKIEKIAGGAIEESRWARSMQ